MTIKSVVPNFWDGVAKFQDELFWMGAIAGLIDLSCGFTLVADIFKPDFIHLLSMTRVVLFFVSIACLILAAGSFRRQIKKIKFGKFEIEFQKKTEESTDIIIPD